VNEQETSNIIFTEGILNSQYPSSVVLDDTPYTVDPRFPLIMRNYDFGFLENELVDEFFNRYCKDCGVNHVDAGRYAKSSFKFQNRKQQRFKDFIDFSNVEGAVKCADKKTCLSDKGIELYLKGIKKSGVGLNKIEMTNNKLLDYLLRERIVTLEKGRLSEEEKRQNQEILKEAKRALDSLKTKWVFNRGEELQKSFVQGFLQKRMGTNYDSKEAIIVLSHYGLIDILKKDDLEKIRIY
jgi:hypothetical protein